MKDDKIMYVTTDGDMWNSADEAHFCVLKGKVKILPEIPTKMIEFALEQGMLREATDAEIQEYEFEKAMEKAISERKIIVGNNEKETMENYKKYLKKIEQEKPLEKIEELPKEIKNKETFINNKNEDKKIKNKEEQ